MLMREGAAGSDRLIEGRKGQRMPLIRTGLLDWTSLKDCTRMAKKAGTMLRDPRDMVARAPDHRSDLKQPM